MERKLNEQWVEELDGKKHMLKAVNYSDGCNGCIFLRYDPDEFYTCNRGRLGCPVDDGMIIKDLGILNENGLLRVPFDVPDGYPLYPTIASYSTSVWKKDSLFQVVYSNIGLHIAYGFFNSEQETKDAWNRRA